jgi:1-deoxy-D-xylulose-5-phosphate reductoisomerase
MKRIAILGSTGSIGRSTLEVIRDFPDKFRAIALSTNSNIEILSRQIEEFQPVFVCVRDVNAGLKLKARLNLKKIKLFLGEDGLEEMIKDNKIDEIVLAISGSGALLPLLKAIETNKDVALANKEALVMAGSIIMRKARNNKIKILPIDSEQSAIWQCLNGQKRERVKHIYLTASGGPFRQTAKLDLKDISVKEVLKHPRWKMGKKISVDSANLMNKGLEVLETMFLFDVPLDKIQILIHPEAVIHSMVEFIDGAILAQLSITDMRIPIQYALSYPERLKGRLSSIDFCKLEKLHFQKPDFKRFPCLALAYRAARELGTMPCVLNAANEVCVEEFLKKRLKFISIPKVITRIMDRHQNKKTPNLDDIFQTDTWARQEAYRVIKNLN